MNLIIVSLIQIISLLSFAFMQMRHARHNGRRKHHL